MARRDRQSEPHPPSRLVARAHRRAVRRRWTRRCLVLLAVALAVGVGGLYLARGPLTRGLALARLEKALGYDATCEAATLMPSGRVALPGLELRSPGTEGEAGVVLRAERIELEVGWVDALLAPARAVRAVRLVSPTAVVSVDVEDGSLNLGGGGGGGASLPDSLPPVRVENARLVFGEHGREGGAPWFEPLQEIALTGALEPSPGEPGVYDLELLEDAPAGRAPAELRGALDLRAGSGRLDLRNVDFGALRVDAASPPVQTLLRRLRVDGRLPEATLRYERDGSFEVLVDLAGVDVLAPVPVLNPEAADAGDPRLRLSQVSGDLRLDPTGLSANLEGFFEDLDARVIFTTEGLGVSADLSVQMIIAEYRLGPNLGLLPFAPELAAEFVQRFSGPEALISGRVTVERAGGAASASGLFSWSEGRAAFQGFPYPIEGISGRLSFNEGGVYVTDLRGRGPTGADITAEIVAIPPGDDAEIGASIVAENVPVDEHLLGAIGGERGEALGRLFDSGSFPPAAVERLARAGSEFRAGGAVRLEIDVEKRGGELGEWSWDVLATSPALGLAPDALGYPLTARGFTLTLDRETAEATLPALEGPTGARGSANATVPLGGDENGGRGAGFRPTVGFEIERAPLDDLLFDAIGRRSERFASVLRELRASGVIAGTGEARLGGRLDADASIAFEGVRLRAPESGRPVADGLAGVVEVRGDRATVTATGDGPGGAGVTLTGELDFERGAWSLTLDADGLPISEELAEAVGVFSDAARDRLVALRAERSFGGVIDARLTASSEAGDETAWRLDLGGSDTIALEIGGERLELRGVRGRVTLASGAERIRFDGASAALFSSGEEVAREVWIDGVYDPAGETRLELAGGGVRLGARGSRALAGLSAPVAAFLEEADPAGEVNLALTVRADDGGEPEITGRVEPQGVELTRGGERLRVTGGGGAIEFGGDGVRLAGLRLDAGAWGVTLDGALGEAGAFEGTIDLASRGPSRGLLAALPENVRAVAETIGLEVSEDGGRWASGELGAEGTELVIGFLGASCRIGAPIEDADGTLTLTRSGTGDGDSPLTGLLRLDRFEAASVPMTAGRATLEWDGAAGRLDVPEFSASCAGGVIRGRARVAPGGEPGSLARPAEFLVDARCAGVPLAWIIDRPEGPASASSAGAGGDDLARRGLITGRLTVRGGVGEGGPPRVGRGEFRITGGEVVRLPLLTPVYELINLQPPVGEELGDAAIEFGLTGDRLVFDRLFVRSASIVMEAAGGADLAGRTLDLAVRTRGRVRVPILSDLINALRDELIGVRITGPIGEPRYEVVQLPVTGRVLLGAIAPGAGGSAPPAPPPARPPVTEHVLSTLEPIDE